MDAAGLMVVSLPIVFPIIFKLGYDPIWFGVIMTMLAETGVITPPVGVNVFVVKGIVPDVPLYHIFRGIVPFLIAILVALIIMIVYPSLATFLPSLMVR
jgi:TRAP-type C4-dicarboxylate transport system permease large subunit